MLSQINKVNFITTILCCVFILQIITTASTLYVVNVVYQNRELVNKTITSVLIVTEGLSWTVENIRNFLEGNVMSVVCASDKIRQYIGPLCPNLLTKRDGGVEREGLSGGVEKELVWRLEEMLDGISTEEADLLLFLSRYAKKGATHEQRRL